MAYERKIKITSGIGDAYEHYKHKKVVCDIDKKTYVDLVYTINKKISDNIIKNSLEFKLPFRLGSILILKNKLKIRVKDGKIQKNKMIVDWEASWNYWNKEYPNLTHNEIKKFKGKQVLYQTNDHSNGYVMSWKWNKMGSKFINKSVYSFKPTKQNRLDLATWIKSDDKNNDYYLQKSISRYEKRN